MNTKKSNKEGYMATLKQLGLFLLSWILTLIFGIIFCFGCGVIINSLFYLDPNTLSEAQLLANRSNVSIFCYGLLSVPILFLVYRYVKKRSYRIFFKYMSSALLIGLFLNILIFIVGIYGLLSPPRQVQSDVNICTSLENQLIKAQSATVPIRTNLGSGTAFAIIDNNTLLTAYHVIDGADEIYASYVGERVNISVLDTAPEFDIALLKIDKPASSHLNLTSDYKLADSIYVMGYPGNAFSAGLASLSTGIVSRVLSNEHLKLNDVSTPNGLEIVQTDAAVNPGNSGGPLFNKCGVVGIVSAISDRNGLQDYGIVSEQGISYAISSKTISSRFNIALSNSQ